MYEHLTVLVVDPDERCREALLTALRRLGLRALGLMLPDDAVGLLAGIDVEVVLVRAAGHELAVEALRRRAPLVVVAPPEASMEEIVVMLLRALGRPDEAARLN